VTVPAALKTRRSPATPTPTKDRRVRPSTSGLAFRRDEPAE